MRQSLCRVVAEGLSRLASSAPAPGAAVGRSFGGGRRTGQAAAAIVSSMTTVAPLAVVSRSL